MDAEAEAAKRFNKHLRRIAEALGGHIGGDYSHTYGFVCECGCSETAQLTLDEYDRRGGAWLPGHHPT